VLIAGNMLSVSYHYETAVLPIAPNSSKRLVGDMDILSIREKVHVLMMGPKDDGVKGEP